VFCVDMPEGLLELAEVLRASVERAPTAVVLPVAPAATGNRERAHLGVPVALRVVNELETPASFSWPGAGVVVHLEASRAQGTVAVRCARIASERPLLVEHVPAIPLPGAACAAPQREVGAIVVGE